MDERLAKIILVATFQSARELTDLLPLLKEKLPESEYISLRMSISIAISHIMVGIQTPILDSMPNLKKNVESMIKEYGRFA